MATSPPSAKAVFDEAVEIASPDERRAYLDRVCADAASLRQKVEALLAAYHEAGSFLESPAASPDETIAQPPAAEQPGTVIGPYKLLELIGEGGMGAVYLAQQTVPVKRLVALKVVKAGMDSRQVLARFEAERQALALMDHPNIAKVLDAGVAGAPVSAEVAVGIPVSAGASEDRLKPGLQQVGRPYFVMELVKGVPITRFCDERRLTPRERLELFLPVCHAIQHAHQKGIIHRDIKPTNVLVALYDGQPVPKVIDFGVAKAAGHPLTEKTLVTGLGAVVGTPEYMSPEQAELNQLDIDTRSDVYSLGILLYELLTGTTPLTRKRIKDAALLEVLRVIREEEPQKPSTRLSTTDELPTIAANRGTEPARLSRLVRGELDWVVMKALEKDRNRRYETANGFAMDLQRYLAGEAVQAVPPSVGYRLRKFARRNKVGLSVAALVLFFLVLLGSGVGWAVRNRSAREAEAAQQQAARQAKVAGQIESILGEVDRLEGEQKWPEALAAARRAEAAVTGGEADAQTAQRVRERVKDLGFIDRLEQIRVQRATLVEGMFDFAGADQEYARAFRDYGVDVEELAVQMSIDRLNTRPALAIPLAAALDDWISCRRRLSKADAAAWKRLVAVARGVDPEPLRDRLRSTWGRPVAEVQDELRRLAESIDVRAQHPATVVILAYTLLRANRSADALRLLRDAHFDSPGDFWLSFELGNVLSEQNDHEEAIRFLTAAASIRPHSSAAHNNLGTALTAQKRHDEAIAAFRKAIQLDPKNANAYNNLGGTLSPQGKPEDAIAAFRKAVELDPQFAAAYVSLGIALRCQNKVDEAVAAYRKAVELNPQFAAAYVGLGAILCDVRGEYENAAACFRKAIELNPKDAKAHHNLGIALRHQNKVDEAIAAFRKAVELDPKGADPYGPLHNALNHQAWILATDPVPAHRDPGRAVRVAKEAVEMNPHEGNYHNTLGVALYRAERWKESVASLEKSMELRKGGDGNDWFFLAMAHWQLGEKDKAREHYDRAVQWMEKNQPKNEELRLFRAEAAELLGLKEKK